MVDSSSPAVRDALSTLITSYHILAQKNVLDGYGHISVRNPVRKDTFFMTPGLPAALVVSRDGLAEYEVGTGTPIFAETGRPKHTAKLSSYSERFIHASILARFPEVNSVVHSHSQPLVARGTSGKPLRAIWHVAGFLGSDEKGVRVWDIEDEYKKDNTDMLNHMLVNNKALGDSLAEAFAGTEPDKLARSVVLQRGHGFVAVGDSIQGSVYRAIYAQESAIVQREAEAIAGDTGEVKYLNEQEAKDCADTVAGCQWKVWPLWVAEAKASHHYKNELDPQSIS